MNPVPHMSLAEIEQQTQSQVRLPKVVQKLHRMNWQNLGDTFDFNDHAFFNNEIGTITERKSDSSI